MWIALAGVAAVVGWMFVHAWVIASRTMVPQEALPQRPSTPSAREPLPNVTP